MKESIIKYGMVIDLDKCIGCYACQVNCQKEHASSDKRSGVTVYTQEIGIYPNIERKFIPSICNHCEVPNCLEACANNALYITQEGILEYDKEKCVCCLACLSACPHGAISYQKETKQINKCDFCYERLKNGLKPACVEGCMGNALYFGDLNNEEGEIAQILKKNQGNLYIQKLLASNAPKVIYIQRRGNLCGSLIKKEVSLHDFPVSSPNCIKQIHNSKETYVNTVDMMCPSECSIKVLIENGRAKKILGNPKSINNQGTVCAKGASGLELVYSPQRIKTPLIRVGGRGSGEWKEVSWEFALSEIAKKLHEIKRNYGAESVILDAGDLTDSEPYMMLFHAFGTPHTYTHSAICDTNRRWGSKLLMGDERPLPDIQRPILVRDNNQGIKLKQEHDIKLLISIGTNPLVATRFNYMSRGIPDAQVTNQMYYVVVDPAFTNSAAKADMWLPITPGTDAELLACILCYILINDNSEDINSSYINHNFIKKYTLGWEDFKNDFLYQSKLKDESNGLLYFSPEWGEEKTGIEQSKIIYLSHLMGITKPAAIEIGMHGAAHHLAGDITSVLANVICAITGNIDVPGGLVFAGAVKPVLDLASKRINDNSMVSRKINGEERHGNYQELHKDLYGDFPDAWKGTISTIPGNIQNGITIKKGTFIGHRYPIKAFINRTGNPLYTGGNSEEWMNAFMKDDDNEYSLELIVHIDTHINETGKYADFILPECSYIEKMGLSDQYTINPEISLRDRVIQPLYESKTPFCIMQDLASALVAAGDEDINQSKFICYKTEEDLLDEQLSKCPGLINVGQPIPYPQYPEKSLIEGVPENPNVYYEGKLIHKGEKLTVKWLRENDGVATWPVSYYRYCSCGEDKPSECYPMTNSRKFEFNFRYKVPSNKMLKRDVNCAFKWKENNSQFPEKMKKEYPFYLITGRTHQTGTMTQICDSLSELETEANRKLSDVFVGNNSSQIAIPVFLLNILDGKKLEVCTGDNVRLESSSGKYIVGKVFLSDSIKPGVVKTTFGSGGRMASSETYMNMASYTSNVNILYDSNNINKVTGMPAFGDMMVRIVKEEKDEFGR